MTRLEAATGSSYPGNARARRRRRRRAHRARRRRRSAPSSPRQASTSTSPRRRREHEPAEPGDRNPLVRIRTGSSSRGTSPRSCAGCRAREWRRARSTSPGTATPRSTRISRCRSSMRSTRSRSCRSAPRSTAGVQSIMTAHIVVRALGDDARDHEPRDPRRPAAGRARVRRPGRHGRARDEGDQRDRRRRGGCRARGRRRRGRVVPRPRPVRRVGRRQSATRSSRPFDRGRSSGGAPRRGGRAGRGGRRVGVRAAIGAAPRSTRAGARPRDARCAAKVTRGSPGRRSSSSSSRRPEWPPDDCPSSRASGSRRSCPTPCSCASTLVPRPGPRARRPTARRHRPRRASARVGARGDRRVWRRARPTRSSSRSALPHWRPPRLRAYVATYGAARVNRANRLAERALYSGPRRGVEQSGSSPGS